MTPKILSKPRPDKRNALIDQALSAFYEHGFHTNALDKMLAASGISKRTVYNHFNTKEDLVLAALERYQEQLFASLIQTLSQRAPTAEGKILALFDLKHESFQAGKFQGCFALNARLAYRGINDTLEQRALFSAEKLQAIIEDLCAEAGSPTPRITAKKIVLLLEGATVYGQARRDAEVILLAKQMAVDLLR